MRNFLADRLNDGETVSERAVRIGIARPTLDGIEANPSRRPAVVTAKKIADFYGVRVTDLWPLEPSPVEVDSAA